MAALVGAITGFGALGFRMLVDGVTKLAFGGLPVLHYVGHLSWPMRLLLPVVGITAAWALARFFAPEARGHGVPEVMDAVALRSGKIRGRVAAIKSLASSITIGCGGSVGREGPIVQIGSALGSGIAQLFKLSAERVRLLVACGAAAGIAATFNAPMAGVIFAVEIIIGSAAIRTFSPIVVSSVMATAVARTFAGDDSAFEVPPYALESAAELVDYVGLGVISGLAAVFFVRVLYGAEDLFEKLPLPGVVVAILGGLIVGGLGLVVPDVYGLGYATIGKALNGGLAITTILVLLAAKMAATSSTLAGGGSGGVFAPSLFLGAMIGNGVGVLSGQAAPWTVASPAAYALVGMGAFVAATTHAPLTAILVIFELTGDYAIILPLMLSAIIASVISATVQKESIYTLKLVRRGVHLGKDSKMLAVLATPVQEVFHPAADTPLLPTTPFATVVDRLMHSASRYQYVVDESGKLLGVISLDAVKGLLREDIIAANAFDVMDDETHAVLLSDTVEQCVDALKAAHLGELPVVDEDGLLEGIVTRHEIMALYQRTLGSTDNAGAMFVSRDDHAGHGEEHRMVELPSGHVLQAVEVPTPFVGKSLRDLGLRQARNLHVVGIRFRADGGVVRAAPDPGRPLEEDCVLVVEGPKSSVDWLKAIEDDDPSGPASRRDDEERSA